MSPQVLRTTRRLQKEEVRLERFVELDGQGLPSYSAAVTILANVVRTDEFVIASDGSHIRTPLTLYVAGDERPLPNEQDRVTVGDETFIGVERTAPRGLTKSQDAVDHVRLKCRRGT